jgi:phosphatidylglycerophosphate synthase
MVTLGWGLGLVIAWGLVSHVVKTWAWRIALRNEKHRVSFARMLGLRLASEAVGQLGALGQLFGEGLRVSLLGPAMPLTNGITSVTLDRALFIVSGAIVSIVGLLAVLTVLPVPHTLALYAGLFVFTLLGVILLSALAVSKRWPVFSGTAQRLGRIRYFSGWIEQKRSLIQSVEDSLLDFYHDTPGPFWASFALNLACHAAAVFEVFLILRLMGAKVSLFGALAIEALTKLVNAVGTFNPGNLGIYEAGNMLIVKMFGLTGAAGLTLAFIRRLRALFWAAIGALCLFMLAKPRKQSTSIESNKDVMRIRPEEISPSDSTVESASTEGSHVAVILANHLEPCGCGSSMPEVGALPIALRSILGAKKAGAARIVVVVHRANGSRIRQELLQTGRLPDNLEWWELGSRSSSFRFRLEQLASEVEGHLVLIAADSIYHPSLHRQAGEWDREDSALVFMTGGEPVGILSLTREVSLALARSCPSSASSIEELHNWLTSTYSVQRELVTKDKWQLVSTEQQRLTAEGKLNTWLVKPTDGIFARTNRRISIPISRQIIRFPITPNMVSLFTLGVSLAAGVFLALGGYWHMLTGAILSWFASVLDGCDGEVARLKFQESAFGCWLETICDYLYYLFIFTGMTIGLARTSGTRAYFVWGGFLVFGTIVTILTSGLQRHRLASASPEQFLRVWQKEADNRRSNPLLYFGRQTEFIIRRCFLPYVFLFFALFNIMNWLLIAGAVGANVVWIISLYSYFTFAPARPSAEPSPA